MASLALPAAASAGAPALVPVRPAFEASSTLKASGSARYDAANLGDGDATTAWAEGEPGPGTGVTVTARLPAPRPARAVEIVIANGYQRTSATFQANAAPRELRAAVLSPSGEYVVEEVLKLRKEPAPQRFVLALPAGATVAAVRFVIGSVHPGTRYEDTCLSDVAIALGDAPPTDAGALPRFFTGFDGWRGFRVAKDAKGVSRLVFPPEFGRGNPEDLAIVTGLVGHGGVDYDVEAAEPIAYSAMAQLRRLAVEYQDRGAAEVIVHADTEGGLDLGGGELSEMLAYEMLAPLLVGYRDVKAVVPPALEDRVATVVCAGAFFAATGDAVDEKAVIRALEKRGDVSLAKKVRAACKKMAEGQD
jgi:hypothetical protein